MIDGIAVGSIVSDSFFLNISICFIECNTNKISSKIAQKDIVKCWVKAHAFELNIIVDFICYLIVVDI